MKSTMNNNMPTKVGIFRSFAGKASEGYQRIGSFEVDPKTGAAILTVVDETQRHELEMLNRGIATRSQKQGVSPLNGSAFLAALSEHFYSSSYWRVVDESQLP